MIEDVRLQALYPFLASKRRDENAIVTMLAESVAGKAAHHVSIFASFFTTHGEDVAAAARTIAGTYRKGGRCDVAIYHILWDLVHALLANDRARLADQAAE
jgi:hypothetical protein